jgi:hypothetical protein
MVLYEERLWTSWRFIAASIGGGAALGVLGVLVSPSDTTSAWKTTFPWFIAGGAVVALVFWMMNFARKLVVHDSRLQMGQTPLAYIARLRGNIGAERGAFGGSRG